MAIKAEEISKIIREQIKDYDTGLVVSEVGTVVSAGDGIARIHGLEKVMSMEMLEFPADIYGLALNLEEDNVGAVLFGDFHHIKEGDLVSHVVRQKLFQQTLTNSLLHSASSTVLLSAGWPFR